MDLHFARLHESVAWGRQPTDAMFTTLTQRFSAFGADAQPMAIKQMMLLARVQGTVMAFADVFLMLALLFAVFGVTAVLMRRPVPAAAQSAPAAH